MKKKGNKRRKRRRNKKNFFLAECLLLAVIFFSLVMLYAWERVMLLESGYTIKEKTAEKRKLLREKNFLLVEVNRLKSPERLEKIAREQLGMVVLTSVKLIRRLDENKD